MAKLKDHKEVVGSCIDRTKATRGKVVKLHGYWKGIASTISDKESRRHYMNMMLDAVASEQENKQRKRNEKDTKKEAE